MGTAAMPLVAACPLQVWQLCVIWFDLDKSSWEVPGSCIKQGLGCGRSRRHIARSCRLIRTNLAYHTPALQASSGADTVGGVAGALVSIRHGSLHWLHPKNPHRWCLRASRQTARERRIQCAAASVSVKGTCGRPVCTLHLPILVA